MIQKGSEAQMWLKGVLAKKKWSVKYNRTNMNGDKEMRQTIKTSSFKNLLPLG